MKILKLMGALVGLLGLGLFLIATLFERIEPGQIGVRQSMWGSSGVMQEDSEPGFHWGVTGLHKWHLLDRRTHFLTYSDPSSQSGFSHKHTNSQEGLPLEIRTSDNNPVSVDVAVTYRIIPGEAHVIVSAGEKMAYQERVASAVRSVLLGELAKSKLALAQTEALRDELRNEALDSTGGRILQARDAAENLQFDSVTLNSNDPSVPSVPSVIDIDELVELLIGENAEQ